MRAVPRRPPRLSGWYVARYALGMRQERPQSWFDVGIMVIFVLSVLYLAGLIARWLVGPDASDVGLGIVYLMVVAAIVGLVLWWAHRTPLR